MYNIVGLHLGMNQCSVDDNIKRMYNGLTSLNRELKNFVTYKQEKLVSIDITCSQPYLALSLFDKNNYKVNSKYYFKKISHLFIEVSHMCQNFLQHVENEDFKLYISLVSNVKESDINIHSFMQDEGTKNGITYSNRDIIKKELMKVYYSSNKHKTQFKDLFNRIFFTIDTLFRQIKHSKKNRLACLMQSIEAYAVLKVITKRFAHLHPNAPLFTIHDSIITTEPYIDNLRQVIIEELTELTGYPPKLKTDYWLPENTNLNKFKEIA